ncbi:MAG: hypothetical protein IIV85_03745, partial [Clostridia bacterium]|nr:hypothetical protein [Clostridia bacterium]
FSLELPQGDGISNTNVWLAPKSLAFGRVNISKTVSDDDERPDDLPDDEHPDDLPTEDLITPLVGTWAASPTEEIIVAEDGTITYNDVEYAPEYVKRGLSTRAYLADKDLETEMYINFRVSSGYASCSFNNDRYYKDRSWEIVTLTPENWSEYFDLEETLEFEYDAWGALEAAHLLYTYSLKETYSERLDEDLSNMAVKFSYDEYWADCTVDAINKTVSIEKPGEYYRTSENTFSILPGRTIHYSGIALNDTRVWYITNIQVARALGTLYFLND